ncbi:MAG: SBBP repeat-containing protein [Ardenticatenaceae bacterium]|nr:SBBP repeat-containing protein [Ardenticatenaceae bacterium]
MDAAGRVRATTALGELALPPLRLAGPAAVPLAATVQGDVVAFSAEPPAAESWQPSTFQPAQPATPTDNPDDLLYATFLGGSSDDWGTAIVVDGAGAAYVTGWTGSPDFPTTPGAFDPSFNGGYDAFVVKLNATGTALHYATFLGGSGWDGGFAIAVDGTGAAYVTGWTTSPDFPTTPGAFDPSFNGGYTDAFVVKLNATGTALHYATFLGESSDDGGYAIAVDGTGAAYVTGTTWSSDFPTTPGAFDPSFNGGYTDAFVVKLNAGGTALHYATFLGVRGNDWGADIAVDGTGAAYVTGWTGSRDFPTTPGAFDPSFNGGYTDAFVVKLNASGSALLYATFLGGSSDDWGTAIVVDGAGAAYVTGWTTSPDFPTTPGAFAPIFNGADAFVVNLNASGTALHYATFLGVRVNDWGADIAVDGTGAAYVVTSTTWSSDFPTTPGAFDPSFNGGFTDAFVVKLNAGGSALHYATFLGGGDDDIGYAIAVDGTGAAYVTGGTKSADFPTTPGAFDPSFNGGYDAFVVKLAMGGGMGPIAPTLTAAPTSVPADGTSTATITLGGAPPGHRVRLRSSRGNADAFYSASGTVDGSGRFATTLRSATPGTAVITAEDLTTGQVFATSTQVAFTGGGGTPLPVPAGDLVITDVRGDCGRVDCPKDGFFMLGLDGLRLPLQVTVDWKGEPPEIIGFSLNGITDTVAAGASQSVRYELDVNRSLREGTNVLHIVARSGNKSSRPYDLYLTGYRLPQWIMDGVNALPTIGNQALVLEIAFPGQPLSTQNPIDWGFPGDLDQFQWQTNIKMTLPTRGGAFEIEISRERDRAKTGRKPKAFLKLVGHEFDLEYGGRLQGLLGKEAPYVVVQELEIRGSIAREFQKDVGVVEGLNVLTPFGPLASRALGAIPQVREWLNDRAKLYIKITPELSGGFTLAFQPGFHVAAAQMGLDFPVELGAKADLWAVEGHIYGGLGGKGTFGYSADDVRIASLRAYGFGGYKFRVTWFSLEDKGEWKLAEYPPGTGNLMLTFTPESVEPPSWQLIKHITTLDYARFRALPRTPQAFAAPAPTRLQGTGIAAQTTVTSVLASNVYTYTEPALALNPATDQVLLLWVHDDVARPVGQSHEIAFSRWDGAAWSAPAGVTDDDRLDGAPQVAWAGDGRGVAVWQRLDDVLPITATFDITTANKIEIATASYDPTGGAWSPVSLLTSNNALDLTPTWRATPAGACWRPGARTQPGC